MKKGLVLILVLMTVIVFSGCKKDEVIEECDGFAGFTGCVEPDFDICDGDCNTYINDIKILSFQKSQALSAYIATYFEELNTVNYIDDETQISIDELENNKYTGNMVYYYDFINDLRTEYFTISTNVELCTESNVDDYCVLNNDLDQTLSVSYKYSNDAFETTWLNISKQEDITTKVVLRGSTDLENYDFEYFEIETGTDLSVNKNTYAYNFDGVMRIYSYDVTSSGNEEYVYYMYDTNTGNYTKYTHDGLTYKLDYYIANHNKLYSIEKIPSIDIAVYSVTYFEELQDYLSVRAIRQGEVFTAINLSYNLKHVEGWDTALTTQDKLLLDRLTLELNGFSLQSIVDYVDGTSPYRLSKDFLIDEFNENGLFISDDLLFDKVDLFVVSGDLNNITLNPDGYETAFNVTFGDNINEEIEAKVNEMHGTLD